MRTHWSTIGALALVASSTAYRGEPQDHSTGRKGQADGVVVDIQDTDEVREVCSGMFGGKTAHIDGALSFAVLGNSYD